MKLNGKRLNRVCNEIPKLASFVITYRGDVVVLKIKLAQVHLLSVGCNHILILEGS